MKKLVFVITLAGITCFLNSCKNENSSGENNSVNGIDSTKQELWAEEVESKTIFVKPEGWEEEYWQSINKNVNHDQLFNTIAEAVLSGKKKAYNLLTDSVITVDELKTMVTTDATPAVVDSNESEPKVGSSDISMLRMREKWVFNKEKFSLEKKVIRIDLTYKKLDEYGKHIGDKPLFYVYLD